MAENQRRRLEILQKHLSQPTHQTDACGIIAVVGGNSPAVDFLLEGLSILQNRGYDSAGVVTVKSSGDLRLSKYASSITTSDALDLLRKASISHLGDLNVGMGHTRWATHGAKTDVNAHPHLDATGRIAVVHNGVIENSEELKQEMAAKGFPCVSATDTEVIAQLIGYYVVKEKLETFSAVERVTQKHLRGSWGIVVLDKAHPDFLIAAAHGSPLLIGIASDKKFIASEASAFAKYTRQLHFFPRHDGDREVVKISVSGEMAKERHETYANTEKVELSPDPFPHWTIKEIYEQPAAIMRALNFGARLHFFPFGPEGQNSKVPGAKLGGLDENRETLLGIDHLIIAACGTSFHSGMWGARMMRMLQAFKTVQVIDAAEFVLSDLPISARAGLLVISQSGETKDVMRALTMCLGMHFFPLSALLGKVQSKLIFISSLLDRDIPCMSVVNAVGSSIARATGCGVYLNAGREVAVASTKAFTSQATVLTLMAIWFAQNREYNMKHSHTREAIISSLNGLSIAMQACITNTR